jgi:hypothetical protein
MSSTNNNINNNQRPGNRTTTTTSSRMAMTTTTHRVISMNLIFGMLSVHLLGGHSGVTATSHASTSATTRGTSLSSSSSASFSNTVDSVRRRVEEGDVSTPSQQQSSYSSSSPSLRRRQQDEEQWLLQQQTQQHRQDEEQEGRILECIPSLIMDFESCSAFCMETTESPLNTFIVLDGPKPFVNGTDEDLQFCCACFSGYAYCSDNIPECSDYTNLDDGTFDSVELNTDAHVVGMEDTDSNDSEPPSPTVAPSTMVLDDLMDTMMVNESMSCVDDANVTDSTGCAGFCANKTGVPSHAFGSQPEMDEYYCICSVMLDGENIFCSDNMEDGWDDSFNNSTIPIGGDDESVRHIDELVRPRFNNGNGAGDSQEAATTTCREEGIMDWLTCEQFCIQSTGHALNSFSTMTGPFDDEPSHCCACYHGDHYCSDNVPSCQAYANLVAIEGDADDETEEDITGTVQNNQAESSSALAFQDSPSCLASDVTSSQACAEFCNLSTGDSGHAFGAIEVNDQYYCICHQSVSSSTRTSSNTGDLVPRPRSVIPTDTSTSTTGQSLHIYCSDNMEEGWQDFFFSQDGSLKTPSLPTAPIVQESESSSSSSQSPRYISFLSLTSLFVCVVLSHVLFLP